MLPLWLEGGIFFFHELNIPQGQQRELSSSGCAGFNARLKSDLVLMFNFNSMKESHKNLYTWHMNHATYKFLLLALTWDLITPNRQSILRNTGASYSSELVHQMSIQNNCWVKFDSATCMLQTTFGSNNGAHSGEARRCMWAPHGVIDL